MMVERNALRRAHFKTLKQAWEKNPTRFVHGVPPPDHLPSAAWINSPQEKRKEKHEAPAVHCLKTEPAAASEATSLTHPRSGYPLNGCVPAEPSSVSPDTTTIAQDSSLNTRAMPKKIPGFRGWPPRSQNQVIQSDCKSSSKSLTHSAWRSFDTP
ncbi:hypothetical protein SV7mr_25040 [Stieleria bergensis]|uniref:Uncharacterized protein n=1 Tax=Stieleria bergensis TaxID=2528025 RepID=A0A517SV54_9BACT|nr:hypothetical protein SV7mr_25040 [Planctomycetes bacterium SV_7m_r]